MSGDEIREWFDNEALRPENLLVLVDDDDRVVGYFDVWVTRTSRLDVDMAAPGCWDETLRSAPRSRARALGAKRVRTFFVDGHELGELRRGARLSRDPRARGRWRSSSASRHRPSR